MKVKNIMFSGFAAAILMGVVAEANAAPVAVASKGYVDSVTGKLVNLEGTAQGAASLVEAINTKLGRVAATGEALEDGEYYSSVIQAQNGQVAVQKANLATAIDATTLKAPTTAAVYNAIQGVSGQTSELDLDAVGGDGKYVKLVSQADGQVSAVEGTIDTELDRTSNNPVTNAAITTGLGFKQDLLSLGDNLSFDSEGKLNAKDTTYTGTGYINIDDNNVITATGLQPTITDGEDTTTSTGFISEVKQDNGTVTSTATAFDTAVNATTGTHTSTAPTTKAVYDAIQNVSQQIPDMPGVCTETGVTCVLTSEGGAFRWAVLTKPVSDETISGTEAQAQVISEPVTGDDTVIENPGL